MSTDQAMHAVVQRIDALVAALSRSSDPAAREGARELAQSLMQLYGAGLSRVMRIVELQEGRGGATMRALLDDDLVASLLVLHDLHPDDAETRIRRALERLRLTVGATLTLLEVRDERARVRIDDARGTASAFDLPALIEEVVRAVAPELSAVEVTGLPPRVSSPLVQIARPEMTGANPTSRR